MAVSLPVGALEVADPRRGNTRIFALEKRQHLQRAPRAVVSLLLVALRQRKSRSRDPVRISILNSRS
ncbi:MAG: hypothetical protein PVI78_10470, partial [Anaerolineales bacterium]